MSVYIVLTTGIGNATEAVVSGCLSDYDTDITKCFSQVMRLTDMVFATAADLAVNKSVSYFSGDTDLGFKSGFLGGVLTAGGIGGFYGGPIGAIAGATYYTGSKLVSMGITSACQKVFSFWC